MSEQGVPSCLRWLQEGAESSLPLSEWCFPWREGQWRVNHANRVGEFGGSERGEDPGGRESALAGLFVVPVVSRTSLCWEKQHREAGTAPTSCVLGRGNGLGTWRPRCHLSCGAVRSPSDCQRLSPAAFVRALSLWPRSTTCWCAAPQAHLFLVGPGWDSQTLSPCGCPKTSFHPLCNEGCCHPLAREVLGSSESPEPRGAAWSSLCDRRLPGAQEGHPIPVGC